VAGADFTGALVHLERICIAMRAPQHDGVILEEASQRRVIRPQRLLCDGDGARVERGRVLPPPLGAVDLG
jgi:hypothetical protein